VVPFRTVYQGIGPGMEVGQKTDKKGGRENQPKGTKSRSGGLKGIKYGSTIQ